ncbi:MAG: long-chain fatty acid--CoA ligase [Candidatus Eisenbacteria bacterium]|uniref:Long-chain fatty acid--CoA ligase n=1 Tax=Eiseniibacteriota bacterium TaxID=2212470 RepID=A0A933S963_UNCEI|nr:long-chain fatty acid--CoA ligase [Candidatus Eisenbacteria bacterium]
MPKTLIQIFLDTADQHDKPAHFMRKNAVGWESISSRQAVQDVESLGLGLASLGVSRGDRVALLSENRYEWALTDLATLGIGAVTVPIYPTLTAQQVRYILENSEAKVCVVSTPAQYDKVQQIAADLPSLRVILAMEPAPVLGGRGQSFAHLVDAGRTMREQEPRAFRQSAALVKAEDLATIIYTSGTTGDPKGAMLSHANIASNVEAGLKIVQLGPTDRSLCFLPLCHIFERMAGMYCMLAAGVTIAYAQSLETVAADAMEVHPTVLTGVPRFYEKVYARVMENALAQPALRKNIFFWGLHVGIEVARLHFRGEKPSGLLALQHAIADKLVGAKVRARVGGNLRFCISGGAPLGPKVMEFFFAVGIPICEGYGLTETSPVICLNPPGRERPGAVGPVVPGVEVRIGEEGEILTRGPHVMMGYFRNEAATAAAIRDGWFHTGDVGHLDDDGYLVITDRLKDLLVTAGGKKVAPQPFEGRLKMSKWISEAVMLGDQRPYCICLLVPNFAVLETEARARGWAHNNRRELLAHPDALALYQREIDKLNADLAPFEQIKKFALLDRDLSQDAGELTPTLKVRRRVVTQKFAEQIESLYAAGA